MLAAEPISEAASLQGQGKRRTGGVVCTSMCMRVCLARVYQQMYAREYMRVYAVDDDALTSLHPAEI